MPDNTVDEPRRVEEVHVEKEEGANPRIGNTLPEPAQEPEEGDLDTSDKGPHPFQPDAEPILVTSGSGRGSYTKEQRDDMIKISPEQAYDDPSFNPVAAMGSPGHNGGPGAPDGEGSERLEPSHRAAGDDHDEKAENLSYDWKGTDPNPEAGQSPGSGGQTDQRKQGAEKESAEGDHTQGTSKQSKSGKSKGE